MRPLFANAAKCEPDSQGRILHARRSCAHYAGLDKDVVIIGVIEPRRDLGRGALGLRWRRRSSTPENLAAVMEELGF